MCACVCTCDSVCMCVCVCAYMHMYAHVFLSYDLLRVVGDSTSPGKVSDTNSKVLQGILFLSK